MALQQISFAFDETPVPKKPEPKAVVIEKPAPEKIKVKGDNKKLTRGRVSLKEKESGADLIEIPDDAVLFEKKYYAIGIVANAAVVRLIGVDLNGGTRGDSDIAQPTAVAAKRRCAGGIIVDDERHAVGGLVSGAAEGVGEGRIEGRDVLDGCEERRSDLAVDGVRQLQLAAGEVDGVAVELPAGSVEVTRDVGPGMSSAQ